MQTDRQGCHRRLAPTAGAATLRQMQNVVMPASSMPQQRFTVARSTPRRRVILAKAAPKGSIWKWDAHGRDKLACGERGLAVALNEVDNRQRPLAAGTHAFSQCAIDCEHRNSVRRWRCVADVADQSGAVANLDGSHHGCGLRKRRQAGTHGFVPLRSSLIVTVALIVSQPSVCVMIGGRSLTRLTSTMRRGAIFHPRRLTTEIGAAR